MYLSSRLDMITKSHIGRSQVGLDLRFYHRNILYPYNKPYCISLFNNIYWVKLYFDQIQHILILTYVWSLPIFVWEYMNRGNRTTIPYNEDMSARLISIHNDWPLSFLFSACHTIPMVPLQITLYFAHICTLSKVRCGIKLRQSAFKSLNFKIFVSLLAIAVLYFLTIFINSNELFLMLFWAYVYFVVFLIE